MTEEGICHLVGRATVSKGSLFEGEQMSRRGFREKRLASRHPAGSVPELGGIRGEP